MYARDRARSVSHPPEKRQGKKGKERRPAESTKGTKNTRDSGVRKRTKDKDTPKTQKSSDKKDAEGRKSKAKKDPKKYGARLDDQQSRPKHKTSKTEDKKDTAKKREWDPEKSYVGHYRPREVERPERKRWVHNGAPITDMTKIPPEWCWNTNEPDLAEDEIEAQIQRCDERIQDGIMTFLFEKKKKHYKERLEHKQRRMLKFPGKSWEVVQRLEELHEILKSILESEDEYKQAANVKALIRVYEKGELDWNPGLVTYWSRGQQLCEPRPHDWDELLKVNEEHNGYEGFWVEGLNGPGPKSQKLLLRQFRGPAQDSFFTHVNIAVRIPGTRQHVELDFLDDSGAALMVIETTDIPDFQQVVENAGHFRPRKPPMVGTLGLIGFGGHMNYRPVVILEVNIISSTGFQMLPTWDRVQVAMDTTPPGDKIERLNGPWMRHKFFTAGVPNGQRDIWVGDLPSLLSTVPTADVWDPDDRSDLDEYELESVPLGTDRRAY